MDDGLVVEKLKQVCRSVCFLRVCAEVAREKLPGHAFNGTFSDRPDASIGSLLIRSYSAITCAPTSRTSAPISTLNSTAMAVVSEP